MSKLKNYTTTVPAQRSINEILGLLFEFHAYSVTPVSSNSDGKVDGLSFTMMMKDGDCPAVPVTFMLPASVRKVQTIIWQDYRETTSRGRKAFEDFEEDAENIAWRILHDWVHAQLSIIRIGMVHAVQVFLPYAWDGKQTLYDKILAGGGKLLTDGGAK